MAPTAISAIANDTATRAADDFHLNHIIPAIAKNVIAKQNTQKAKAFRAAPPTTRGERNPHAKITIRLRRPAQNRPSAARRLKNSMETATTEKIPNVNPIKARAREENPRACTANPSRGKPRKDKKRLDTNGNDRRQTGGEATSKV